MSRTINRVELLGLGSDPELRRTQNGTAVGSGWPPTATTGTADRLAHGLLGQAPRPSYVQKGERIYASAAELADRRGRAPQPD